MSAKKNASKSSPAGDDGAHALTDGPSPDATASPEHWRVRVRMHRQGVGDCFLLTFRNGGDKTHVLIDCGVLPASPAEFNRLESVVELIRSEIANNGGKLDVIVVTHEHADHVSAFLPGTRTAQILKDIPSDEVWMAWTENPDDELARKLSGALSIQALAAASVLERVTRIGISSTSSFARRAGRTAGNINDILENFGISGSMDGDTIKQSWNEAHSSRKAPLAAKISRTVREAMNNAKSHATQGKFRTFVPGQAPHSLPGISKDKIRVYVLGPPRIENLKKSPRHGPTDDIFHLAAGELPALARSLAAASLPSDSATESCSPFSDKWQQRIDSVGTENLENQKARYHSAKWRKIDDDWLMSGGDFAMQLDSATNNSSLVLAFEMVETGEVLLFPGDAQIENWETWRNLSWMIPDQSGALTKITGEDLLRRTVFYKVGHHGSHNATLNEHGLQLMPSDGLVAMLPVIHAVTAKRKGDWKEIPKPSLCKALEKRCGEGFIRMDAEKGSLPGRLGGRIQEHELYIDYYLV